MAANNPNEMRLEELKAIKAKIAAEEARLKAEIAAENAAEEDAIMNAKADAQLIAQARGLEGDRDEDARDNILLSFFFHLLHLHER